MHSPLSTVTELSLTPTPQPQTPDPQVVCEGLPHEFSPLFLSFEHTHTHVFSRSVSHTRFSLSLSFSHTQTRSRSCSLSLANPGDATASTLTFSQLNSAPCSVDRHAASRSSTWRTINIEASCRRLRVSSRSPGSQQVRCPGVGAKGWVCWRFRLINLSLSSRRCPADAADSAKSAATRKSGPPKPKILPQHDLAQCIN